MIFVSFLITDGGIVYGEYDRLRHLRVVSIIDLS